MDQIIAWGIVPSRDLNIANMLEHLFSIEHLTVSILAHKLWGFECSGTGQIIKGINPRVNPGPEFPMQSIGEFNHVKIKISQLKVSTKNLSITILILLSWKNRLWYN